MKTLQKLSIGIMVLCFFLAFPAQVSAQPVGSPAFQESTNGKVVFGGFYRLESGQTLEGGLVIFGGQGILEESSTVNGDVLLTGGSLNIDGIVTGDVVAVGGSVDLGENAVIQGDVTTIGAAIKRADGAVVEGTFSFEMPGSIDFGDTPELFLPHLNFSPRSYFSAMWEDFKPIRDLLWKSFQALALAALAAILFLFLEKPTERVSKTLVAQPLLSGGLGLLTTIVAPALFLVLIITIILIPLGVLGFLGIGLAILYGWIAIGYEVGKRISTLAKQVWAPPITAGIGTLMLSLLSNIMNAIPCIGWVLPALIAVIGLGAVVISRFGTQVYNPTQTRKPVPITAPEPAMSSQDRGNQGEQNLLRALESEENAFSEEFPERPAPNRPDENKPANDKN